MRKKERRCQFQSAAGGLKRTQKETDETCSCSEHLPDRTERTQARMTVKDRGGDGENVEVGETEVQKGGGILDLLDDERDQIPVLQKSEES